MVYSLYNVKLKTAGASIHHTPRGKHENEIMKSGDGQPFNEKMQALAAGSNQWDPYPFVNPVDLTAIGYASSTWQPVIDASGNLYVVEGGDTNGNVHKSVGLTDTGAELATALPDAQVGDEHWSRVHLDGTDYACGYFEGTPWRLIYRVFDGDDLSTLTKDLELDASWSQALYATWMDLKHNPVTGNIDGIVNAWSSVPNNYKSWIVHWDYSTGLVTPDINTIYKMSNNVSEFSWFVYDPDDSDYLWSWRGADYSLRKFKVSDATNMAEEMDFSGTFSTGVTKGDFDPAGNLCMATWGPGPGPELYMFDGFSTTLRT